MGMLDGKYWVVNGGRETLGVTDSDTNAAEALKDAYLEDNGLPEEERAKLSVRYKFDQMRLVFQGLDVADYYATNEREL